MTPENQTTVGRIVFGPNDRPKTIAEWAIKGGQMHYVTEPLPGTETVPLAVHHAALDENDKLRAKIEELRKRLSDWEGSDRKTDITAWQPIETAPRDGTDVLLLYQHRWMAKPQPIVGGFFQGGWYSYELPEHEIEAVKWAPIPELQIMAHDPDTT